MRARGFTLLELLVAMGIIALLAAIAVPAAISMGSRGRQTAEVAAARQIIAAYHLHAADHRGQLLAGYKAEPAADASGRPLDFPANARYPWKLAPYLNYNLRGSILVNEQEALLDLEDPAYAISAQPSFGINATFVGGDYGSSSDLKPSPMTYDLVGKFCVTHMPEAVSPGRLLVFASARSGAAGSTKPGYFMIRSPNFTSRRWPSAWNADASPGAFGFIDLRHDDRAVAAMLDGHVELLDFEQLQDMRRWSNQAAEAGDPEWVLTRR